MLRLNRASAAPVAALTCVALTVSACSTEDSTFDGIPVFPVEDAKVTVVEPGRDPQQLRYKDVETQNWDTTVAISAGIDQATAPAGSEVDAAPPRGGDVNTTTLPLTVSVSPAPAPAADEAEALRQVDFTVGEGRHSDLEIGRDVASAKDFLMRWRSADTGDISTLQLLAPQNAVPRGLQIVEPALLSIVSANVIFPDEPVGVGGVWKVDNRVAGDASTQRSTTYTVASIEGDVITLNVDVEERPTQNNLKIDDTAAGGLDGQDVTVESANTTSEGQLVVDLTKPLPVSGQVAFTTRLIYSGQENTARVVQDITRAVKYGA